jgi:hypothetical protein
MTDDDVRASAIADGSEREPIVRRTLAHSPERATETAGVMGDVALLLVARSRSERARSGGIAYLIRSAKKSASSPTQLSSAEVRVCCRVMPSM